MEDNTSSELVYRTRLRGSYKIFDAEGNAVDGYEFPVVEDKARNRRRDFYVHLPVHLAELAAGQYTLQLNIDDLNGNAFVGLERAGI